MKALIMTADGVEDIELQYPLYRLLEEGFEVVTASPGGDAVTAKHGQKIPADESLDDVREEDFDLLVLPGGKGPEKVRLNANALEVTRTMMQTGRVVAAICHGPQILTSAGVIAGRRATCWKGVRDDLIAAGADFLEMEVVVDDNLVTSRQPSDLPAFSRKMIALTKSVAAI